jgi:BirA family biotin operon repressor/biotin-[acetyl-CoA-carboxylase] ligase
MNIIKLENIDSTNTYAKSNADKIKDNTVIIANRQTDGYGTNNRKWYSDSDSIICSFLIKKSKISITYDYSYKIGIIVSNLLNKICNIKTYIKEPNDIYLNGKKLGGILIETKYSSSELKYVIIGIGINVNQDKMPVDIRDISTSLYIETNKKYNKEDIIKELINKIECEVNQ